MTKPEIKCRTLPELKEELRGMGEKPFRAGQIFQWLHQGVSSFDEMTNVSKQLRRTVSADGAEDPAQAGIQTRWHNQISVGAARRQLH